jgi:hypothetical protein
MNRLAYCVVPAALSLAFGVGCSSPDPEPNLTVLVDVSWNDNPETAEQIGFQVHVDIGWLDRVEDCYALSSALNVTVNDRPPKAVKAVDCSWDVLTTFDGFLEREPITVRLRDHSAVVAEATYEHAFLDCDVQLVSPAERPLRAGEALTVSLSRTPSIQMSYGVVDFFWRDPTEGVPPFHSSAEAILQSDTEFLELTTPAVTGRAYLLAMGLFGRGMVAAEHCNGFRDCVLMDTSTRCGPLAVEVVP